MLLFLDGKCTKCAKMVCLMLVIDLKTAAGYCTLASRKDVLCASIKKDIAFHLAKSFSKILK